MYHRYQPAPKEGATLPHSPIVTDPFFCPTCPGRMNYGCKVCWACFKYREPAPGVGVFRDFAGTLEEFILAVKAARP